MLRPQRFEHEVDPGPVQIQPRKVHFDFSGIPLHWIPGHPVASDMIVNPQRGAARGGTLVRRHLQRSAAARKDPKLADDMRGFIDQEAIHADVHERALHEFI